MNENCALENRPLSTDNPPVDYLAKARSVIRMEIEAIETIAANLDSSFNQAITILQDSLDQKNKIVVIGIGKSGNIGHKIAATLNSTGATAVVLNSQNALHGDLGLISDGDTIIALSQSGETTELLNLLPFLKRFDCSLIAFTGGKTSTLARQSDVTLDTAVPREACPLNLAPTSSSTAMLVMGDALAMVLLEARGFTEDDFARYHPGGALGRALLTRVSDIMRAGDALATTHTSSTINDALLIMSEKRTGACLVLNDDDTLAGIFTHGDFARSYQSDPNLGTQPVTGYMTRNPVSLRADSLAAEAIKTVSENRIDDIVVINEHNKPVGLIDSQDFARQKLV